MKRKFTILTAAFMLLAFLAVPLGMRGQVVSGTTYNTTSSSDFPTGWSYDGEFTTGNTPYLKLVASSNYIQTSDFAQNGFTSIVLKARKFGGPSNEEALITVSWYNDNTETVLGTITPTSTNLSNYTISSPNNPTGNTTGYIKIQCKGASGSKGSGVSAVTITYTAGGSTPPTPTYTVTYNANGGTGTMTDPGSPYEENDEVTLLTNDFTAPEGKMWDSWSVKDANNQTITVTNGKFNMPASDVTVTAQWVTDPNATQYEWVETSLSSLVSTDIFVIVGNNGSDYALSSANGTSSAPPVYAVTIADGKINTNATPVTEALKFNISGDATNGYTFYSNGSTTNYIYCTNTNNGVRVGKPNSNTTEEHSFTVTNGYLTVGFSTPRYIGIYNSSDWRCYTDYTGNIANQTFKYYKRQVASNDPVISATDPEILPYNATGGEFAYSITNPTGATLTAVSNNDWITNVAVDGTNSKVTFSTSTNAGAQRQGTITLSYTGATDKVITITQNAAPAPTITADDVEIAFNATSGEITYTLNNPVVNGTLSVSEEVAWISNVTLNTTENKVSFTSEASEGVVARSGIVTITYTYNTNQTISKEVTVTQGVDATLGTSANPFTVAQARAFIDGLNGSTSADGQHVGGIISQVDSYNSTYHSITYWISADGTTTSPQLEVYSGKGLNGADFSALTDVVVGAEVVVKGKLKYFSTQSVYEFDYNNELVSYTLPTTPLIDATAGQALAYDADAGSIVYEIDNYVTGTMTATSTADWISNIQVVPDPTENSLGEVTFAVTTNTATENRTATVTLTFTYGTKTTSANVTVTQLSAPAVWITPASVIVGANGDVPEFVITYASLEITSASNFDVVFFNSAGTTSVTKPTWIGDTEITASATGGSYDLAIEVNENTGDERYAYFKIYTMDDNGLELYSDLVAITQSAPFQPIIYTRATSIISGGHYIIVGFDNDDHDYAYAMAEQRTNNRGAVIISEDGTNAIVVSESVTDFIIESVDSYYSIKDPENGYLYAAKSDKNWLMSESEVTNNSKWTIEFDATTGVASIDATLSTNRSVMQFNPNTSNSNPLFACYNSASQQPVYLYEKSTSVTPTNNSTTVVATDFSATTPAGYRLIASPVNMLNPKAIDGMLSGNYDLYAFDQNEEGAEWRNYKVESFLLESGKGYLYASASGTAFSFIGAPYAGNGVVSLDYTDGKNLKGWNLIGNPFAAPATLNMPYYKMNDNGDGFTAKIEDLNTPVGIMEGVFVQATAANQTATFTAQTSKGERQSGIAKANINVIGANGTVIDNAIVRFDEGQTLEKFMLHADGTKIFFTEDHKDYAIVRSNGQGQLPVNFKAAENGTYTIDVEAENLEVNYLHLIDNLTGMDVDLLATPSYTFEARKSDIASRFRLVFDANTGNDETNDNFAFINNGELIVNGNGTVQVIDILGRQMFSHEVNSAFRIQNSEFAPGVYVLRLVNGNDVKTQKIVIK